MLSQMGVMRAGAEPSWHPLKAGMEAFNRRKIQVILEITILPGELLQFSGRCAPDKSSRKRLVEHLKFVEIQFSHHQARQSKPPIPS